MYREVVIAKSRAREQGTMNSLAEISPCCIVHRCTRDGLGELERAQRAKRATISAIRDALHSETVG